MLLDDPALDHGPGASHEVLQGIHKLVADNSRREVFESLKHKGKAPRLGVEVVNNLVKLDYDGGLSYTVCSPL